MSAINKLMTEITKNRAEGKSPKFITFDKATFESLKLEWKEQKMYDYCRAFLFGIPFKVIDGVEVEYERSIR